jgi:predicted phosphodiesterase
MRRRRFVLLASLVLALAGASAAQSSTFLRGPYAGAPDTTSIVISWVLANPAATQLEVFPADCSTAPAASLRTLIVPEASAEAGGQVDVLVSDLAPATTYVYRVLVQSGEETTSSPLGRFRTAPQPGQAVAFAVLSDTQRQWEGIDRLAAIGSAIALDSERVGGFDFVLHAGDLVEAPTDDAWDAWFASFEPMLLSAPFVPVLGNHENNSASYYTAFAHPAGGGQGNERWWALHWGDVVVVGLDTTVTQKALISQQVAFARAELGGSEPWKVVVFHRPLFSSDATHGGNSTYANAFHPLFLEMGVSLVLSGHAHDYERIVRDGITYLVVGGGGAVPRSFSPRRVEGSVVAVEGHDFYARVTASQGTMSVDVVSVAEATSTRFLATPDTLLDSFVIPARAADASTATDGLALSALFVRALGHRAL